MWKSLLPDIQKIEERYGSSLREPATKQEIARMIEAVWFKFNFKCIPRSYIEFLGMANGLDFNGLVIYGVDRILLDKQTDEEVHGFIGTNELWYENEWQKQYIFFGDSDSAWYCYDVTRRIFLELDKPSGTEMNTFVDFDAMLQNALETRLV